MTGGGGGGGVRRGRGEREAAWVGAHLPADAHGRVFV